MEQLDPAAVLVSRYVHESASSEQRAAVVKELSQLLQSQQSSVLAVVAALQDWLISDDSARRVLGTHLLAQLLESVAGAMSANDLHHLSVFMSSRLADWPCVQPAAAGCAALLRLKGPAGARRLAADDALAIVRVVADEVAGQVQQLAHRDRSACLHLLLSATLEWGVEAAQRDVNLVEAAVAAVDGEKDPRCLMTAFKLIPAVAGVYHTAGVEAGPLEDQAEEVVEVLSCYFPLTFNPPKSDPHNITRADLAAGLMGAMSCSPLLVRWALPLVLEKLSSTYRPAKEDALAALAACCSGPGNAAMQEHARAVWVALRTEVMGPSAYGMSGDDLRVARELAGLSARCLRQCAATLGQGTLEEAAAGDGVVADLLAAVRTPSPPGGAAHGSGAGARAGGGGGDPGREDRQLECAATVLGAVAAGGPSALQRLGQAALDPLLALLPPSPAASPPDPDATSASAPMDVDGGGSPARDAATADAPAPSTDLFLRQSGTQLVGRSLTACRHFLQPLADASQAPQPPTPALLAALQPPAARLAAAATECLLWAAAPQGGGAENGDAAAAAAVALPGEVVGPASECLATLCTLHAWSAPGQQQQQGEGPSRGLLSPQALAAIAGAATRAAVVAGAREDDEEEEEGAGEAGLAGAVDVVARACAVEPSAGVVEGVVVRQLAGWLGAPDSVRGAQAAGGASRRRALRVCGALARRVPRVAAALLTALTSLTGGVGGAGSQELLRLVEVCVSSAGAAPLGSAASASAKGLAVALMQDAGGPTSSSGTPAQAPLALRASTAGRLATSCSATDQAELAGLASQLLCGEGAGGDAGVVAAAVLAGLPSVALGWERGAPQRAAAALLHQCLANGTPAGANGNGDATAAAAPAPALAHAARAIAVASLVNKAPDEATLQQLAAQVAAAAGLGLALGLDGGGGGGAAAAGGAPAAAAAVARPAAADLVVAWLAAALARRSSPLVGPLIRSFVLPPASPAAAAAAPAMAASAPLLTREARAAATLVHTVFGADHAGGPTAATVGAPRAPAVAPPAPPVAAAAAAGEGAAAGWAALAWHHVHARPLWQQRTLVQVLPPLLERLTQATATLPPPPLTTGPQGASSPPPPAPNHLAEHLALSAALCWMPLALLRPHLPQLLRVLRHTLGALCDAWRRAHAGGGGGGGPAARAKPAVDAQGGAAAAAAAQRAVDEALVARGVLGVLGLLLALARDGAGAAGGAGGAARKLLEGEVADLLPAVCACCALQGLPAVREAALVVLAAAIEALPYHLLHTRRAQVVKVVTAALDDERRGVRLAAARCRRLWVRPAT